MGEGEGEGVNGGGRGRGCIARLPFISFIWSVVLPERGEGGWLFYVGQEMHYILVLCCLNCSFNGGGGVGRAILQVLRHALHS